MKVRIERVEQISPSVRQYFCRSLSEFSFSPGQYLSFFIPKNDRVAIRAYSFCSLPSDLPNFQLCVKQVPNGIGTSYLADNVGRVVEASEPAGEFVLPSKPKNLIFLAGGTGIAPVRSQIFYWFGKNRDSKVNLYYRHRGDSECLFEDEFLSLVQKNKKFSFIKSDSLKEKNWISKLESREIGVEEARYYVVGPPDFVNDTISSLEKNGISEENISIDIWE